MPTTFKKAQEKELPFYDEYSFDNQDNLNEVKLGNFPEIEVYVIVSCFNHSLFLVKDFHRHVVTPTDL